MVLSPAAYAVLPTVGAVLAFVLVVLAWDRRPARGATAFAAVMASIGVWSTGYVLQLLSTDPASALLYVRLSYVGIVTLPPAWLVFSGAYTGEDSLNGWRAAAALGVEPLLVLGLVWTNPEHGLMWAAADPVTTDGIQLLTFSFGLAFWAHAAYAYLLFVVGFVVLIEGAGRVPGGGQRQVAGLILAAVPPIVGNVLYLAGLGPAPLEVDLTTVGFAVGGIVVFIVLFQYGLLDLPEVAQERLFETIEDPIFVLDAHHRIIRCNPAAEALLNVPASAVRGQPLPEVLPGGSDLFDPSDDRAYRDRIALDVDGRERSYAVTLTSLFHTHQDLMGRLVVLRSTDATTADA